jgi:branched-chain amino acid transport system ATP-binding protein
MRKIAMLEVRALDAFYGSSQVLFGVDLKLSEGRVLTVLGRNGAGRTTLARALVGRVVRQGSVRFLGREVIDERSFRIARAGVSYVPENREVFDQLNVEENLQLGQRVPLASATSVWNLERCYELFPRLAERRFAPAGALSGGEQQMLVLCRALMGNPRLLVIDEPTEGLSPQMVQRVADTLLKLKREGLGMMLIEQKLDIALELADDVLVLGHGEVVFFGTVSQLRAQPELIETWVGVA